MYLELEYIQTNSHIKILHIPQDEATRREDSIIYKAAVVDPFTTSNEILRFLIKIWNQLLLSNYKKTIRKNFCMAVLYNISHSYQRII